MPKLGMEPLRRRELIEAAIAAIHDRGMPAVTMGEIARRAGVSAALAHHYFGSKDGLLIATMRHLLFELAREARRLRQEAGSPEARLHAVVEANFGPEQFRPAVISAWLAFYMQSAHDAEAARLLAVYLRRLESNLVAELATLMPRPDARRVARGAAALIDGLWLRAALPSLAISPEEASGLVRSYLAGEIAARRSPAA